MIIIIHSSPNIQPDINGVYHYDKMKYIFMRDNNVYINERYVLMYNDYIKFGKGFSAFRNACSKIEMDINRSK